MNTFKNTLHNVHTERKNKVALCHHDDMRYLIPITSKTFPWDHFDYNLHQTDPEINVQLTQNAIHSIACWCR